MTPTDHLAGTAGEVAPMRAGIKDFAWGCVMTDLGHGVEARFLVNHDEQIRGVIHEHPAADGSEGALGEGRCHGYMPFDGTSEGDTWAIVSGDPDAREFEGLTLAPSSACKTCGHHGFIVEGRWVSA